MTVTREMLGAAHDILLKNGLMLSGVMLEEIYEAMRGRDEQIAKLEGNAKQLEAEAAAVEEENAALRKHIAKLEAALKEVDTYLDNAPTVRAIVTAAMSEGRE